MTLSRLTKAFACCITCKVLLFKKEYTKHNNWNQPSEYSRVLRHYRTQHEEIFDHRFRC